VLYIFPSLLSLGVFTRVRNKIGAKRHAKAQMIMVLGIACVDVMSFIAVYFTVAMYHTHGIIFTNSGFYLKEGSGDLFTSRHKQCEIQRVGILVLPLFHKTLLAYKMHSTHTMIKQQTMWKA
jgi:hypothetical protein